MIRHPFRASFAGAALLAIRALPAAAQEGGGGRVNLLTPNGGLMFWTILIFAVLLFVLSRYAFKPMLAAVEAREQSLQRALDEARQSREEAARVLEQHRQQLESARGEAQRLIAEGRATAEKMRTDLLEQTRAQQQEMLERARRDIETEKTNAIADLRREAVDLAIAGASKVIERNLDTQADRKLVESFLVAAAHGEEIVRDTTIARNYAEALLALARKAGDLDAWGTAINGVAVAVRRRRATLELPRRAADLGRREEDRHRQGVHRKAAAQDGAVPPEADRQPPPAADPPDRGGVRQSRG